ncbi:MAG: YncE family protein [bacterium]|nr:YncE family protein [bacterium]
MLLVLFGIAYAAGCGGGQSGDAAPPGGSQGGALTLRISTGSTPALRLQADEVLVQTIPATARLEIALLDENGSPVVPILRVQRDPQQPSQTVAMRDIPVGTWLLSIVAFDSADVVVGGFSQRVAIRAGEIATVVASLTPIASPSPSPTVPPTPVAQTLAVSLRNSPDIALIDVATLNVTRLANIAVDDGGSPDLLRSLAHQALYVVDSQGDSGDSMQVYDTTTNLVRATLLLGSSSSSPFDLVMLPDQSKLFVSVHFDDIVKVIDPATDTVTNAIDVGAAGVRDPHGMALSADGTRLFVAGNFNPMTAAVIDVATETVTQVITGIPLSGTKGPRDVAVSPDGTRLWFTAPRGNDLAVYDAATLAHLQNVTVQGSDSNSAPRGIAFTPDGTRLVVTLSASTDLAVVDTATNTQVASIPISPAGVFGNPMHLAMDAAGRFVFVTHPDSNQVLIVDLETETVHGSVSLPGDVPTGIIVFD